MNDIEELDREERIHRLEAAYYGARMAFLDADRAVHAVRSGSPNKFEAVCANREVARTRMFDTSRKLDG